MKVVNLTLGVTYNGVNKSTAASLVGCAGRYQEHLKVYNAFGVLLLEVEPTT